MSAPFKVELVALGDPKSIELAQFNYENTAVLVFVAELDEVRKAAPIFRQQVALHPDLDLETVGQALKAAGISLATRITPEVLVSGISQLALQRDVNRDRAEKAERAESLFASMGLDRWPVLIPFIAAMVKKLDANKPKKGGREGWRHDDPIDLIGRVREEREELLDAIHRHREDVLDEAADVANMAMMVADACGVLP